MAKKTKIDRLRELAIKRINMQFPKPKPKIKKLHFLEERRRRLLRKIAETTDIKNVKLSGKEKTSFHDEIKQKGGLIKWAKSKSYYIKILKKDDPSRHKAPIDKETPPKKKKATSKLSKNTKRSPNSFMRVSKIDKIWKEFCKSHLKNPNTPLRVGSYRLLAKGYVDVKTSPVLPIKQLSTEVIFESWLNRYNNEIAKNLINQDSSLSLQKLLVEMIQLTGKDIECPYIWWIYPNQNKKNRLIYRDADGDEFVKIDKKWQIAYSVRAVGSLVGRQGGSNYEDLDLPFNSYFVVWENKDNAKNYVD
ncbi:hypothetical protein HN615_06175 [Candidatus Woesearchaeota archaeon]|mgnify:FL=1|jgi:hypothetical protein|nr:hypothetical protein [Candidatus Woesearchaeota archaeon]